MTAQLVTSVKGSATTVREGATRPAPSSIKDSEVDDMIDGEKDGSS